MNTDSLINAVRRCGRTFLAGLLLGAAVTVLAGPGAHGPGGEHLDAPTSAATGAGLPRVEAHTDLFELVAQLHPRELSLLIDRYDSNEPVLGAQVEVESGGVKAAAKFHADHGDYVADDERLLALLRGPGEHPLVITVVHGADSDLLDGMLRRPAAMAPTEHGEPVGAAWTVAALALGAALVATGYFFIRRRARALPRLGERA